MKCIVQFCRKECPSLPDDAEVLRADGQCLCDICRKPLREHQMYSYPSGMGHAVRACRGVYYHL